MNAKLKAEIKFYSESITGSYGQVLFSNHMYLALLVMLASFADPWAGSSGFLCVITSILFARWMGFDTLLIRNGTYSYNSLLVGLAIGVFFKFTIPFFVMLLLASLITLLISVSLSSFTALYKIPFLSLPFIIAVWIILLSARNFGALQLSERGIYTFNELWKLGGPSLVSLYEKTDSLHLPFLAVVYLKSLGAIFFQYNLVSGLLIALGLLIYSRIAFSLSIIGFITGYLFCYFVNGNLSELDYSYIGFNYILSAIAIGGFFLVASARSYLFAIVTTPLIGILISALGNILSVFQLPLYSLPFTLVVMLLLYVLNNRADAKKLFMVQYQQFSPEKNLYTFHNRIERFKNDTYFHIQLPFYGEWLVSQAHDGKITHKEDYRYAFDFVIADETKKTFRLPGKELTDFYCYGIPVLAPASGYVVNLVDGIEDNKIGDVNIEENWGNSIVIKHAEYLYSKISHIKKGSFKVKYGDYVHRGDIIAACGNSGRSPEPHIHFQLQATPYIGAKTIKYPISYYVNKKDNKYFFRAFDYPEENQTLFRTSSTPLLQNAFHFIPGMIFHFEINEQGKKSFVKWEVFVDAHNLPFIYCYKTNSYAYFTNNETLHYFTDFKGDRKSLLYYFYLGAHKILLSYFQDMEVKDILPLEGFYTGIAKFIQDFIAPFKIYLKAEYISVFKSIDNTQHPGNIKIESSATARTIDRINRKIEFEFEFENNRLAKFIVKEKEKCISAQNIG